MISRRVVKCSSLPESEGGEDNSALGRTDNCSRDYFIETIFLISFLFANVCVKPDYNLWKKMK